MVTFIQWWLMTEAGGDNLKRMRDIISSKNSTVSHNNVSPTTPSRYQQKLTKNIQSSGEIQWFININPWTQTDENNYQQIPKPVPNKSLQARTEVNNTQYHIDFIFDTILVDRINFNKSHKISLENVPDISFNVAGVNNYSRTGAGAMNVFGNVLKAVLEYIETVNPNVFQFAPADAKLALQYERMAAEFLKGKYVECTTKENLYFTPEYGRKHNLKYYQPGSFIDDLKHYTKIKK